MFTNKNFVKLSRMAALSTAAASLVLVGTVPRSAAAVPNCVTTRLDDRGFYDYLSVTNGCSTTQRVKVVLAFMTDIPCQTLRPGQTMAYRWGYPGRFDRLQSC